MSVVARFPVQDHGSCRKALNSHIDGVRRGLRLPAALFPVSLVPPGPGQALDAALAVEGEFPGARMGRTP